MWRWSGRLLVLEKVLLIMNAFPNWKLDCTGHAILCRTQPAGDDGQLGDGMKNSLGKQQQQQWCSVVFGTRGVLQPLHGKVLLPLLLRGQACEDTPPFWTAWLLALVSRKYPQNLPLALRWGSRRALGIFGWPSPCHAACDKVAKKGLNFKQFRYLLVCWHSTCVRSPAWTGLITTGARH